LGGAIFARIASHRIARSRTFIAASSLLHRCFICASSQPDHRLIISASASQSDDANCRKFLRITRRVLAIRSDRKCEPLPVSPPLPPLWFAHERSRAHALAACSHEHTMRANFISAIASLVLVIAERAGSACFQAFCAIAFTHENARVVYARSDVGNHRHFFFAPTSC
jgi:hypothetical protein